jgi:SAM-dependent MidA family methyltransferase
VTVLTGKIRDIIQREGPIPFSRFMDVALYDPESGYYSGARDPFGAKGDFFTAEQLQPVFGRLIAAAVEDLWREMGQPADFAVIELGAGRGEMAEALARFKYTPVDIRGGTVPERFTGVVFSNEFFDALPVDVATLKGEVWHERLVDFRDDHFEFVTGPPATGPAADYIRRFAEPGQRVIEVHSRGIEWLWMLSERLERGFVLTIDYGYTRREASRFEEGSLMSYRRHLASEDVLSDPGSRDITSHVPFGVFQEEGQRKGLRTVSLRPLVQFLTSPGERRLHEAIEGGHSLQLKTLLFGMGENFRVLLQEKN